MEKEETESHSLLEERVSCGDTEAMLMLAECKAYGTGMEQDLNCAEALISKAATKGNKEAKSLMKLISIWKGGKRDDAILWASAGVPADAVPSTQLPRIKVMTRCIDLSRSQPKNGGFEVLDTYVFCHALLQRFLNWEKLWNALHFPL